MTADGGLHKQIVRHGTGSALCDETCSKASVTVHYVGRLHADGAVFDSSRNRDAPFTFSLGEGHVIKGWDVGVATMRIGEVCRLLCAPEYAYGATGAPPSIPPAATLCFEVELLDFEPIPETASQAAAIATRRKVEGNAALTAQNDCAAAYASYSKGIGAFEKVLSKSESLEAAHQELLNVLHLNAAIAAFKCGNFAASKTHSNTALSIAPSQKAYFRLAQANGALGAWNEAFEAIGKGAEAFVDDAAAFSALKNEITAKKHAAEAKEKALYAKMFSK